MEVLVGEKEVPLVAHKTYQTDGCGVVGDVAGYNPFVHYAACCAERGPIPSAFVVRNITRIAQRIVGVVMDVECDTNGTKTIQTVNLSEHTPVILLPVAIVNDAAYALLIRQRRISAGCHFTIEAFSGKENDDGSFTGPNTELITSLGFDLTKIQTLGTTRYTVGNEGMAPYKVCSVSISMQSDILATLQQTPPGIGSSLVAVRLDEVMASVNDAKASLAASLILTANRGGK